MKTDYFVIVRDCGNARQAVFDCRAALDANDFCSYRNGYFSGGKCKDFNIGDSAGIELFDGEPAIRIDEEAWRILRSLYPATEVFDPDQQIELNMDNRSFDHGLDGSWLVAVKYERRRK
jgi:hypothetical protein